MNLPAPKRYDLSCAGYNIVEKESPSLQMNDTILINDKILRTYDFEKRFSNHYSDIDGKM